MHCVFDDLLFPCLTSLAQPSELELHDIRIVYLVGRATIDKDKSPKAVSSCHFHFLAFAPHHLTLLQLKSHYGDSSRRRQYFLG